MKKMNKKGFTLIELLAVIVLLAIVAVFAGRAVFSRMNAAKDRAAATTFNSIVKEVQNRIVNGEKAGVDNNHIICDDDKPRRLEKCTDLDYEYNAGEYKLRISTMKGAGNKIIPNSYYVTLTVKNGIKNGDLCNETVISGASCNDEKSNVNKNMISFQISNYD